MAQMFDHTLIVVKGWPEQTTIDWNAPAATSQNIIAGRVISLASTKEFRLGFASQYSIPYFAKNSYTDFDAMGDTIAASSSVGFTGKAVSTTEIKPNITGLCITNGYHVQSTEWTGTASNFVPNAPLKADATTGIIAINDDVTTYQVIGYVNQGIVTNQYGKQVVDFIMFWRPIHA